MTIEEKKGIASVIALNGLVVAMSVPELSIRILRTILPFLPLLAYSLVAVFIHKSLWQHFPKNIEQKEFDRQQAASLTLTGFCFTSISMLASFFKDEIKNGNPRPLNVMFLFSCALIAFIGSYTLLRSRKRRLADYFSEGCLDSGVWCILAGMWTFFDLYGPSKVSQLFFVVLILFALFIGRALYLQVKIS